jgi:hypothetical protein
MLSNLVASLMYFGNGLKIMSDFTFYSPQNLEGPSFGPILLSNNNVSDLCFCYISLFFMEVTVSSTIVDCTKSQTVSPNYHK